MNKEGTYIYGIIPNIYSPEQFRKLTEVDVNIMTFQNICLIVSNIENNPLDNPDRLSPLQ